MAFTIPPAQVRITAKTSGQEKVDSLRKSIGGLDKGVSTIAGSFSKLKGVIGGALAALAVREVVNFSRGILTAGDELAKLEQKTGVSVEALAALRSAADLSGVAFGQLEGTLKKFSVNLGESSENGNKARDTLAQLGIRATDSSGRLRNTGDILFDLADKFAELPDGANKARIAFLLFGKSGADLVPLLNQGSDAIRQVGLAIDSDFAKRSEAALDAFTVLGVAIKNQTISAFRELLPTIQQVAEVFTQFVREELGPSTSFFKLTADGIRLVVIALDILYVNTVDALDGIRAVGEVIATTFINVATTINQVIQAVAGFRQFKDVQINPFRGVGDIGAQLAADSQARFDRLGARRRQLSEGLFATGGDGGRAATTPKDRKTSVGGEVDLTDRSKEIDSIARFRQTQEAAIATRRLELDAIKFSKVEYEKLVATKKLDDAATQASLGLSKQSQNEIKAITEEIKAQQLALIDLEQAQKESYGFGARQAFKDYLEAARDVAGQTREAFANAFQGLEDSLVDFVTTGKLSFRDLANTIIADIIRIQIRQAIVAPLVGGLNTAFGFADGGIMTSGGPLPLKKYATGGVARSPQLALFGEGTKPEAFVPLPDGRTIPVTMSGEGQGGGVGANFNINVTVASSGATTETSTSTGQVGASKALGDVVTSAVKAELIKQLRPGGLLA